MRRPLFRQYSDGLVERLAALLPILMLSAVAVAGAVCSGPALAQGGHGLRGDRSGVAVTGAVEEFVLPEAISAPFSIAVDATGKVWFAEKVGKALSVYDPEKKHFESHPIPSGWGNVGPSRIALGPGGHIWFTVRRWADSVAKTNLLGEFSPADGSFTRHLLDDATGSRDLRLPGPPIVPDDLLVDASGAVWFPAPDVNEIYRFDPTTGALRGFRIPTPHSFPRGLAIDREGVIWFVEANVDKIARLDPGTGKFDEYAIPTPFSGPAECAIDAEGRVWFVEMTANRIGVFYPDLKRFDEALIPTPRSLPTALAAAEDGKIWFVEYRGNKIGVFDPTEATFEEFQIPSYGAEPASIAIDYRRGRLWFSEANTEAKRLGMLSIAPALALAGKQLAAVETAPSGATATVFFDGVVLTVVAMILALTGLGAFLAFGARRRWR